MSMAGLTGGGLPQAGFILNIREIRLPTKKETGAKEERKKISEGGMIHSKCSKKKGC